jgi:hypothetical protein
MLPIVTAGRRSTRWLPFAALLAVTAPGASPALAQPQPNVITVILTELQFNPKTITLTVGQPVQLNVQNQGLADHNMSSRDEPDSIPVSNVTYQKADNDPRQLAMYEVDSIFDTDANSGHTSVVTFTPTKVGTFRFISNAGDDELNGMVGTFVVVAPGGAVPAAAPAPPAATTSSATVARDGQSLSSQSAATQAVFTAVWGNRAATEWVQEHNAALPR